MTDFSPLMDRLINALSRLPGIGRKSAQRLAFQILKRPQEHNKELAWLLQEAHSRIHPCPSCGHVTEEALCSYCTDPGRDQTLICVVEQPQDVIAIEKTRVYKGLYHVLMGVLAPLDGIGPQDLHIDSLLKRISSGLFKEIIIATNPTVEGEATATYLTQLCKQYVPAITRLAYGIPVGGDLEYADEITLSRALTGRILI